MEPTEENLRARAFANTNMTVASGEVAISLDLFATWALIAQAGFLTLLLTSASDSESVIPISDLKASGYVFLSAAAICLVQKYLSAGLSAMSKGVIRSLEVAEKFDPFDRGELFRLMKDEYPRPGRYLVSKAIRKMEDGDLTYIGRMTVRIGFVHSLLMILEAILLAVSFGIVIGALSSQI